MVYGPKVDEMWASGVPVLDSAASSGVDDLGMKDELAKGEAEPLARSMAGDEARSSLLPGLFLSMVRPAGMAGGVELLEELETLAAREA